MSFVVFIHALLSPCVCAMHLLHRKSLCQLSQWPSKFSVEFSNALLPHGNFYLSLSSKHPIEQTVLGIATMRKQGIKQ